MGFPFLAPLYLTTHHFHLPLTVCLSTLQYVSAHVLHFFPFLANLLPKHTFYWPFSVPISCLLFVASAAVCRFISLEVKGVGRAVEIHRKLRSGTALARLSYSINALYFLATLLVTTMAVAPDAAGAGNDAGG